MAERDTIDFDILIVGAGPAGLSAAIRLSQLQKAEGGGPLSIAVIEKAREAGAHSLSGAVLDPSALRDLIPDYRDRGAPTGCDVRDDRVLFLTPRGQVRFPFVPAPLSNHGCSIVSLALLVKWLAVQAESAGVELFTGFGGSRVLVEEGRVVGVRTADRGLDRSGAPQSNYEPGADLTARVTIFCDGVRGNLTKQLVSTFGLADGRLPQTYSLGLKELWELAPGRLEPGRVVHTLGFPLRHREFGGGFIYGLPDNRASIGLVTGLDYEDPMMDPHALFQRYKQHPFVAGLLDGGTLIRYGAKALPEGGWHAIPRLHVPGGLIAGDAGGLVNSIRLKGIHLAMRSGMLAAETAFAAVRSGDTSAARLVAFDDAIGAGHIHRELHPVRNVHQAFQYGLAAGMLFAGASLITGGWWFRDRLPARAGHERMRQIEVASTLPVPATTARPDRRLTFDKATSVHYSGTKHRESAPSHLIVHDTDICRSRCRVEYANPCTRFCPAEVYAMVDDGAGGQRLQINASNCVHCKTCDIMDPYQIIDWVPPEGGDGPEYEGM